MLVDAPHGGTATGVRGHKCRCTVMVLRLKLELQRHELARNSAGGLGYVLGLGRYLSSGSMVH